MECRILGRRRGGGRFSVGGLVLILGTDADGLW